MMVDGSGGDASNEAVLRDTARAGDIDRYLAALLAPRSARADLITLTAFLGEIARIPEVVSEPMMGEIRLQWWRDVLEPGRSEGSTGSPVADALLQTIARHRLPLEWFHALLEARSRELTPDDLAPAEDLQSYLDAVDGTGFRLASRILAGEEGAHAEVLQAAGRASGRVRLLRGLPAAMAKGHGPLPIAEGADWSAGAGPILDEAKEWLQKARSGLPGASEGVVAAVLPLALVEPYLQALQGLGADIARVKADISPLTRVWRLWWASKRRRI